MSISLTRAGRSPNFRADKRSLEDVEGSKTSLKGVHFSNAPEGYICYMAPCDGDERYVCYNNGEGCVDCGWEPY